MRHFVVLGRNATASDDFSLDDVPGTSGRLDVGLRCLRAALLVSHGVRRDSVVYLLLGGGPRAPRVLRVRGSAARFLRPDERSLAVLAKKALAVGTDDEARGFVEARPGVSVVKGGLDRIVEDIPSARAFVLEQGAPDVRQAAGLELGDVAFFLGDSTGIDGEARVRLDQLGARPVGVGPIGLHAEDAIAIVSNELDRREAEGTVRD
jgi:tRNA (pseudouridine54-N1)-methyltransferase